MIGLIGYRTQCPARLVGPQGKTTVFAIPPYRGLVAGIRPAPGSMHASGSRLHAQDGPPQCPSLKR